eukprot:GHVU01070416.1.p1 GENE.GHVU01070416.1~~GHVU01070416.1.p1  ORF type:complete len:350 (+),score=57.03 GHVU01070416.1:363-1412(+)
MKASRCVHGFLFFLVLLLALTQRASAQTYPRIRNLRIVTDTSALSDGLQYEQVQYFRDDVIPAAVKWLEKLLPIVHGDDTLWLKPSCDPVYETSPSFKCKVTAKNWCGLAEIAAEYLGEYENCTDASTCATVAPGLGFDGDLLVLFSSKNSTECKSNLIAFGGFCRQLDSNDRPITGNVNICPAALSASTYSRQWHTDVMMIVQPLLRVLGVSRAGAAFWRDVDGNPRTPRNSEGLPPSTTAYPYYVAANSSVALGTIGTETGLHFLKTEKVVDMVKNHSGCDGQHQLPGLKFENEPGFEDFWERRSARGDVLTAVITEQSQVGPFTVAALADSGWYYPELDKHTGLAW